MFGSYLPLVLAVGVVLALAAMLLISKVQE
jgi:hypothetical protein